MSKRRMSPAERANQIYQEIKALEPMYAKEHKEKSKAIIAKHIAWAEAEAQIEEREFWTILEKAKA